MDNGTGKKGPENAVYCVLRAFFASGGGGDISLPLKNIF